MAEMNGHKYGNFHSYYTFHGQESRSLLLPQNFFLSLWTSQGQPLSFTLLDIGCNEGNLTIELYNRAKLELPTHIKCCALGVDLDSELIDRANLKTVDVTDISFQTVDIMSKEEAYGVSLIERYCVANGIRGFSFVSQFSITMWIHLNHGDVGLETFLSLGAALLSNVGSILVEPQPWKCYRNAVRRCRKMNLPLPLHYSDLLYKDPDSAVCACMARTKTSSDLNSGSFTGKSMTPSFIPPMSLESYIPTVTVIKEHQKAENERGGGEKPMEIAVGSLGCGLKSYSPLGTEVWGRSLLVFHSIAAPSDSIAIDGSDYSSLSLTGTLRILPLPQGLMPKIAEVVESAQCKKKEVRDRQGRDEDNERVMKRKANVAVEAVN